MKYVTAITAVWLWAGCYANVIPRQKAGGSGPYPAASSTDADLPGQTIYLPTNVPADFKIPVMTWCGAQVSTLHQEIASYGVMVVAGSSAATLTAAANWVYKVAGSGKYANVDKTRLALSGWSYGGLEAYTVDSDPRWTTIGLFSSGQLAATNSPSVAGKVAKPVFYFLGGGDDPAQVPGYRDFSNLPKTTPAWIGTDNKGHAHIGNGTGIAGLFAAPSIMTAAVAWTEWTLRGNANAAKYFTDNAVAAGNGWVNISSQSLDKIAITPL